jgi:hypothetical protein
MTPANSTHDQSSSYQNEGRDGPAVRRIQSQFYAFPAHQQAPHPGTLATEIGTPAREYSLSRSLVMHVSPIREATGSALPLVSAATTLFCDFDARPQQFPALTRSDRPPLSRAHTAPSAQSTAHIPVYASNHPYVQLHNTFHTSNPVALSHFAMTRNATQYAFSYPDPAGLLRPVAPALQRVPVYAARSSDNVGNSHARRESQESTHETSADDERTGLKQQQFVVVREDSQTVGTPRKRVEQACENCRRRRTKVRALHLSVQMDVNSDNSHSATGLGPHVQSVFVEKLPANTQIGITTGNSLCLARRKIDDSAFQPRHLCLQHWYHLRRQLPQ